MSYSKDWEEFLKGAPVDPSKLDPIPDFPQVSSVPDGCVENPWVPEGDQGIPFGIGPISAIVVGPASMLPPMLHGVDNPVAGQQIVIRKSLAEQDFREFLECVGGGDVPGYPRSRKDESWGLWANRCLLVAAVVEVALVLWLYARG